MSAGNAIVQIIPEIDKEEPPILTTPTELLSEIPRPGAWERWRDPAWKKYALKMDTRFDEILSYHVKLVHAVPTTEELRKDIDKIVKKALSLKCEHTLKCREEGMSPNRSRGYCREFAEQLRELQHYHLLTEIDVKMRAASRNQERAKVRMQVHKKWLREPDIGPASMIMSNRNNLVPQPSVYQRPGYVHHQQNTQSQHSHSQYRHSAYGQASHSPALQR